MSSPQVQVQQEVLLQMNAEAVSLLASGKHDHSHFTLQKALEGFRTVLSAKENLSMNVEEEDDDDDMDMYTVEIHDAQHKAAEQQSMVTLYNRAFVLTSDDHLEMHENLL